MENRKIPHPLVAVLPIVLLIAMLVVVINLFGSDALSGGSQIALIMGMAVCVFISMVFYHVKWKAFEQQMAKTMGGIFVTIMILLAVGMLAGSWMISGVVPTLIYYGIELLSPEYFRAAHGPQWPPSAWRCWEWVRRWASIRRGLREP